MKLYSQRDARWREKELAPGYNFAGHGHLTTCVSMIASLAGYDDTPLETARKLRNTGAYVGRFVANWDKVIEVYPNLIWDGDIDWRGGTPDLRWLKNQLSTHPFILEVSFVPLGSRVPRDQHYVIAEKLDKHNLQVIDPWTGTRCDLLERYALDNWDISVALLRVLQLHVRTD